MVNARRRGLIGWVVVGLLMAAPGARASCIDYAGSLRWVAGVEADGEPRDLVIRDGFAFVLTYDDAGTHLQILDVTDPTVPQLLADVALPGAPMDMELDGSQLLVAALDAGLLVIDVVDPATPELRWVVPTPGEALGVAVLDGLIVVADGSAGITTLVTSFPGPPRVMTTLTTTDRARGVAMLGERVVVADGSGGLLVVEVTSPEFPTVRAQIATPGYARDVATREAVVCVADGTAGLSLYDLSIPDAPRWLATRSLQDRALRVGIEGSMAVVADATGGTWLLDITEPTEPDLWGRVGTVGLVNSALLNGPRLYIADSLVGLQVFEVGNRMPDPLGGLDTGRETIRVARRDDLLVLGEASAVTVVDIASVQNPIRRGSLAIPGWVQDLALFGDYVAVVDGAALWVVSIENADEPKLVSHVPFKNGTPTGVDAGDDHLYVTAGWGNTPVFNVRRPHDPVRVAELETPGFNTDVVIDGHLAYVLDRHFGLHVFDVSDPRMAEEIAILDMLVRAERAALANGRLCVAFRTLFGWPFGGLVVIDVSDPTGPRTAGQIFSPGAPMDVAATDQFVYLADGWTGVQVVELGTLGQGQLDLRLMGRIEGSGPARGVALTPDAVLVAEGRVGLRTYPPQCEAVTPVFLTEFTATHETDRVVVRWSTAYPAPLVAFDVHRRGVGGDTERRVNRLPIRFPQPLLYEDTDIVPGGRYEYRLVAIDDGASRSYGPIIVSVPGAAGVIPVRVAPNPFTRSTRIVFDLPAASRATLEIFDSGGRLLRALVADLPLTAGRHVVEWDGRDGRGRSVSPGVYTYRLRAGSIFVRGKAIRRQ